MDDASVNGPNHQRYLKDLYAELRARGHFEPTHFWKWQLLFWIPAFVLSYLGLILLPFGPIWLGLAPLCSVAILTMGFVGHDAGHYALSRKRRVNDVWGHVGMTLLCGMSFGNWRLRHNLHHSRCQEIDGDPDMHFGVIFSVYPNSGNWHTPFGRFFLRIQKWAFWPLASLYWVSLRTDAIRAVFQRPTETKIERFLLPFHWIVLLVIPGFAFGWPATILAYLTMSCLSSLMTASVFIPNHIGMRRLATGEKLSYFEQQITTSRNVSNPRLFDFYYGGLNSQIEHHLFPRVSRHRYRAMRPVVRAFCEKHGIPYHEATFYRALASVSSHLGDMTAAYVAERNQQRNAAGSASP
jgi:fatty acid desaturase